MTPYPPTVPVTQPPDPARTAVMGTHRPTDPSAIASDGRITADFLAVFAPAVPASAPEGAQEAPADLPADAGLADGNAAPAPQDQILSPKLPESPDFAEALPFWAIPVAQGPIPPHTPDSSAKPLPDRGTGMNFVTENAENAMHLSLSPDGPPKGAPVTDAAPPSSAPPMTADNTMPATRPLTQTATGDGDVTTRSGSPSFSTPTRADVAPYDPLTINTKAVPALLDHGESGAPESFAPASTTPALEEPGLSPPRKASPVQPAAPLERPMGAGLGVAQVPQGPSSSKQPSATGSTPPQIMVHPLATIPAGQSTMGPLADPTSRFSRIPAVSTAMPTSADTTLGMPELPFLSRNPAMPKVPATHDTGANAASTLPKAIQDDPVLTAVPLPTVAAAPVSTTVVGTAQPMQQVQTPQSFPTTEPPPTGSPLPLDLRPPHAAQEQPTPIDPRRAIGGATPLGAVPPPADKMAEFTPGTMTADFSLSDRPLPRGDMGVGKPTLAHQLPSPTPLPDLVTRQILPNIGTAGSVSVTLSPIELGTLRFEVTPRGEGLHLHLTVEAPATLDLLRRQGDQILAELRQAGFAQASLSFAPGGDQTGGDPRGGDARDGGSSPTSATSQQADPAPIPRRQAQGNGLLDMRL